MPNAVLAAVVFLIGLRLVDFEGMSDILRLRPGEFAVAAVTTADGRRRRHRAGDHPGDRALDRRAHLPQLQAIRPDFSHWPRTACPRTTRSHRAPGRPGPGDLPVRGQPVLRQHGPVHRGGRGPRREREPAAALACGLRVGDRRHRLPGLANDPGGQGGTRSAGVTLVLCDMEPRVRQELDAYGLTALIGEDHLFDSLAEALAAYRQLPPRPSA